MMKAKIKVITTTEFEGDFEADTVTEAKNDAVAEADRFGEIVSQHVTVVETWDVA